MIGTNEKSDFLFAITPVYSSNGAPSKTFTVRIFSVSVKAIIIANKTFFNYTQEDISQNYNP